MRQTIARVESEISAVTPRRRTAETKRSVSPGRYYIDRGDFLNFHERIWRKQPATLILIDRMISVELEVEKLLIFVHKSLGHDLDYLNKLRLTTFFQLLKEADRVQKARERSAE